MNDLAAPLALECVRFKGDRDYLHGTDILPAAIRALCVERDLSVVGDIDIVFHALARTCLTLFTDMPSGSESRGRVNCRIEGVRRRFVLVENGLPIVQRDPYPEDRIVAVTTIDALSATATSDVILPFTSIERWIAMVKALHHAVYPQAQGKWLFTRAKLSSYQDEYDEPLEHRVSIQSDFGGKLTRSALTVGGHKLGDIFFALA